MPTRGRAIAAGALVALAAALLSTGCSTGKDNVTTTRAAVSATPSATQDPVAVLTAATRMLAATSYRYAITGTSNGDPVKVSGAQDMTNLAGSMVFQISDQKIEVLRKGGDRWVRVTVRGAPTGWYHVSAAKLPQPYDRQLVELTLAADSVAVLRQAVAVQPTGTGRYTGTVDLTRDAQGMFAGDDELKVLGDRAKNVPFTATLDERQRLTAAHIEVPQSAAETGLTLDFAFTDYGTPVTITTPSGAREAPQKILDLFALETTS